MADDKAYYRFIRPFDWFAEDGKPERLKSSAFKDGTGGYSVDADFGRSEEECVEFLLKARSSGLVKEGVIAFAAHEVVGCNVDVIDDSIEGNPFHKIFVDDATQERKRLKQNSKIKCLRSVSKIVQLNTLKE